MQNNSYQQGLIDGIQLWGAACSRQGQCDNCPIGSIRGTGVTCQEFAKEFPAKMVSILTEMSKGELSYYEEYCTRFPMCNMTVEILSKAVCRKAVFEGYINCEGGDCVACWKEKYVSDVTEE